MKLEEAIVYLLASSGHGMKTEQIANLRSRQILDREGSDKNGYWVVLIRE
ncbi:MAG: hypothetical protein SPL35_03700 [Bacteroidales bacterium]|nr:hypothetical protein [Bacteroidales bacterium]